MRLMEISAFLALSGALHLSALAVSPQSSGGTGGDAGTADFTLQAATPTLAAMVAMWTQSPTVSDNAPQLQQPVAQSAPERPTQTTPITQPPALAPLSQQLPQSDKPVADTRLPAPLVPLAKTDTLTLSQPNAPSTAPQVMPSAMPRSPSPRPAPQLDALSVPSAPSLDTTPPTPRFAPTTSERPVQRPDRPAKRAAAKPSVKPSEAQRPAQTARGSKAAKSSPANAPARKAKAATGPSKAQVAEAQAQWGGRIRTAVARAQRYPNSTRARGTVKLQIAVSPNGRVTGISVVQSSGDARLDRAAIQAVKRARLPRAPKELTRNSYRFDLPLAFKR